MQLRPMTFQEYTSVCLTTYRSGGVFLAFLNITFEAFQSTGCGTQIWTVEDGQVGGTVRIPDEIPEGAIVYVPSGVTIDFDSAKPFRGMLILDRDSQIPTTGGERRSRVYPFGRDAILLIFRDMWPGFPVPTRRISGGVM